jgi:biotin carboxyl carrier protein
VGLVRLGDTPRYVLSTEGRLLEVLVEEDAGAFNVQLSGRSYEVETGRSRGARRREEGDQFVGGKWLLRAPLTGVVVEVRVGTGDQVEQGTVLMVVEAMKMLNELRARVPGIVSNVFAEAKARVEIGAPLVEISEVQAAS